MVTLGMVIDNYEDHSPRGAIKLQGQIIQHYLVVRQADNSQKIKDLYEEWATKFATHFRKVWNRRMTYVR